MDAGGRRGEGKKRSAELDVDESPTTSLGILAAPRTAGLITRTIACISTVMVVWGVKLRSLPTDRLCCLALLSGRKLREGLPMPIAQHCRHVRQYRRVLLALGSTLLLSGWAVESAADTPTPERAPERAPEQRRAELLKQGADALRKGRPLEALARWRAAWDIRNHYEIACDIGTAELLYGSSREAATFLSICVREHPASSGSSPRERGRLEEAQKNLAKALEKVGRLAIIVSEGGAEVRIDGHTVGVSPLGEIFVDPGVHRISVERAGYRRGEAVIDIAGGAERTLSICLERLSPSEGAGPCPLASATPLPSTAPERPAHPGGGASVPIAIAGLVLSATGVGLGVGLTAAGYHAEVERDGYHAEVRWRYLSDCSPAESDAACAGYVRSEQSQRDLSRAATVSFIGAGAVAAATVLYIAFPRAIPRAALQRSDTMIMVHQW
jgi:hypothetical protein